MFAPSTRVVILPRVFARHFTTFPPLRLVESAFELPAIDINMVWHERSHRLSMHAWLRGVIRDVVERQVSARLDPH